MTIIKVEYPRDIAICLNADGSLIGAHQCRYRSFIEDGVEHDPKMLDAEPIDAKTLAAVLPGQAKLMAQVQGLVDELKATAADRDREKERARAISIEADGLSSAVAELSSEIAGLKPQLAAAKTQLAAAEAALARLAQAAAAG